MDKRSYGRRFRRFIRAYNVQVGQEYSSAKSGPGSKHGRFTKPLVDFLVQFIHDNNISSMVEASSGHWRSGWQSHVSWPNIVYHGIDQNLSVIRDNQLLLEGRTDKFGFLEASFNTGNMIEDDLPSADLLFTKDTLIHFSNTDMEKFFLLHRTRYKYILCVHDGLMSNETETRDVNTGDWRRIQLSAPPFNLPTKEVFRYPAQRGRPKIIELLS